jgi:hypothetical protein
MQFGREPLTAAPATISTADGERGWICSVRAEHFQLATKLLRDGHGGGPLRGE